MWHMGMRSKDKENNWKFALQITNNFNWIVKNAFNDIKLAFFAMQSIQHYTRQSFNTLL